MLNREARYFNSHSYNKVRKDYHAKRMENPFYKNRGAKKPAVFKFFYFIFLFFVIGLIWLLFYSPLFTIKKISIEGLTRVPEEEIKNQLWTQTEKSRHWIFSQKNLLAFDKAKMRTELIDQYNFSSLEIKRGIFHNLKLKIGERSYAYIWIEKNNFYYLDSEGYLVENLPQELTWRPEFIAATSTEISTSTATSSSSTEEFLLDPKIFAKIKELAKKDYPIIENLGEEKMSGKKLDLDREVLDFAHNIQIAFSGAPESGLDLDKFILNDEFNTIRAVLSSGLTIIFSTKEDYGKQVKNLFILKEELKNDFNKQIKNKIDLRYGDRVYYD